jgi:hypothetical protein
MSESAAAARLPELPAMTDRELGEYVSGKLNIAIQLACEAEHERRSGRWASAEAYQRQWEDVMAEVKRLLPVVRNSGVSIFPAQQSARSRQRQKDDGGRQ